LGNIVILAITSKKEATLVGRGIIGRSLEFMTPNRIYVNPFLVATKKTALPVLMTEAIELWKR